MWKRLMRDYMHYISKYTKELMLFSLVISDGSSFHKVGAATTKVLSPVVFFELNVGGASRKRQSNLRLWADEFFTLIRSLI
jgi:hypothetical protein